MNSDRKQLVLLLFGALILSFVLSARTPSFPLSQRIDYNDSPIYKYIGYMILKGKAPYVDVFDHKGIYFYFISALGYLINEKWGAWLLLWPLMFGIVVVLYRTSRTFLKTIPSLFITIIISSGICSNYWEGVIPDTYALFLSLISFYLLSKIFLSEKLTKKDVFLIGLSSGVSFWIKPNMISGTLIICACIIIYFAFIRDWGNIVMCFIHFSVGFIVATIPGILWLIKNNALAAMIEDYFAYNSKYISFYALWDARIMAFSFFMTRPDVLCSALIFLMALFSMLSKKNDSHKTSQTNSLMLCFGGITFLICILQASMPGNKYAQYTLLLYPALIYLLISSITQITAIWDKHAVLLKTLGAIALCLVLAINGYIYYIHCVEFWSKVPQEDEELGFIVDNTYPDETISVISPFYSGLYLASHRDSATKYIFVQSNHYYNMKHNPELGSQFWKEYTELLVKSKPRMIIYDKTVFDNSYIKGSLKDCLSLYEQAGSSAKFDFYILPRNKSETIPIFTSDTVVPSSEITLEIPSDMWEAYKNGDIPLEDLLKFFDDAMAEKTHRL